MTQEGKGDISTHIPEEVREKIGCHVHGCDVCQDACPRNQAKLKMPKKMDAYTAELAKDITLPSLLHMDEAFYESHIKPILYNYIRGIRYFRRNAAIAMGNLEDAAFLPELEKERENPDEMIQEAVAWAIRKIAEKTGNA